MEAPFERVIEKFLQKLVLFVFITAGSTYVLGGNFGAVLFVTRNY